MLKRTCKMYHTKKHSRAEQLAARTTPAIAGMLLAQVQKDRTRRREEAVVRQLRQHGVPEFAFDFYPAGYHNPVLLYQHGSAYTSKLATYLIHM